MPKRKKDLTTYDLLSCPHCEAPLDPKLIRQAYNERYDAYFCPYCFHWLEAGCDDPGCDFCFDRPSIAPVPLR